MNTYVYIYIGLLPLSFPYEYENCVFIQYFSLQIHVCSDSLGPSTWLLLKNIHMSCSSLSLRSMSVKVYPCFESMSVVIKIWVQIWYDCFSKSLEFAQTLSWETHMYNEEHWYSCIWRLRACSSTESNFVVCSGLISFEWTRGAWLDLIQYCLMKYMCVYAWSRYLYDLYTYLSLSLRDHPYVFDGCFILCRDMCAWLLALVSYFLFSSVFLVLSSLFTVWTKPPPIYIYIYELTITILIRYISIYMGVCCHLCLYCCKDMNSHCHAFAAML